MSEPGFDAGPDPRVELLHIGREQRPVLILDGLLSGAKGLVDFAAEAGGLAPVKAAVNFYPGVRAPAPPAYVRALITALRPHLAETFGVAPERRAHVTCALSMAVLPAHEATPVQRLPHIDTTSPTQLAILHYLCGPEHGGTAFYRHRASGFETVGPDRSQAYLAALRQEMAAGIGEGGYIRTSNAAFEQTAVVGATFNRIVVYASNLLHAGLLPDQPLNADPRLGRLTANTFFRAEIA